MKYTFREPYILLKQYTSKQGFGNGRPAFRLYFTYCLVTDRQTLVLVVANVTEKQLDHVCCAWVYF